MALPAYQTHQATPSHHQTYQANEPVTVTVPGRFLKDLIKPIQKIEKGTVHQDSVVQIQMFPKSIIVTTSNHQQLFKATHHQISHSIQIPVTFIIKTEQFIKFCKTIRNNDDIQILHQNNIVEMKHRVSFALTPTPSSGIDWDSSTTTKSTVSLDATGWKTALANALIAVTREKSKFTTWQYECVIMPLREQQ